MGLGLSALRTWPLRRWWVAGAAAFLTLLVVGLPTAVVPNPVFGRSVPVTGWSWPVLAVTAVLGGLLAATYVWPGRPGNRSGDGAGPAADRAARLGGVGGLLAYLAVGCPVCNKLVLLALGSAGALQWFAPVQPYLAAAGLVLLAGALVVRLRGELACPVPGRPGYGSAVPDSQASTKATTASRSAAVQPSAGDGCTSSVGRPDASRSAAQS